jgi:hypothetical protein
MPAVAIILFTVHGQFQKVALLLSAGISALVDKADPSMLLGVAHDLLERNAA